MQTALVGFRLRHLRWLRTVSWNSLGKQEITLATSPSVKLMRPVVASVRTYPVATTDHTTSGSFNTTSYAYTWWGSSPESLVVRSVTTTLPAVSTANNGSGTSNTRKTWFNHFGQSIVTRMPNGRLDTTEYDATTGLLIKQTTDAPTPTSSNFTAYADLPSSDMPAATMIAGESAAYGVQTTYGRDALGRVVQTTANAESSTSRTSQSFYTRLADRRIVRLDVPAVDTSTTTAVFYGPISASVVNHHGIVEESGLISPSDPTVQSSTNPSAFTTTALPRTWLEDPLTSLAQARLTKAQFNNSAGNAAALITYSYLQTSFDGSRVIEARRYTNIPVAAGTSGDWLGVVDTNYDRTLTQYNGMGLVDREVDFTNTIDRYRFDAVGRVVRHERGTNDTTSPNMRPLSSVVYDATNYGTFTTSNLNLSGLDGRVTQVYQHPSGTFNGVNDIHSAIRYDALGNAVNLWTDEGPFLASAVDNLGRTTEAAAFDGIWTAWNSAAVPVGNGSTIVGYRKRYAKNFYDELGRVYQQANFAVNPTDGQPSGLTDADTVRTNYFRGANGAMKYIVGTNQTMIARDRLCQVKTQAIVVSAWATGTPDVSEAAAGSLASQVVIAQTNYYYDPNHHNVVATVSAQRGTTDISATGEVLTGTAPPIRGPLIDIPATSTQGWLSIGFNGTDLQWGLRTGATSSRLFLNIRSTEHDRWLDVPVTVRDFGDPLRHPTPYWEICCGVNCGDLFPNTATVYPYKETKVQYDPRRMLNMAVSTDWESGDRTINARFVNPAGQLIRTMAVKRHVSPTQIGLPELPDDQSPLVPTEDGCCDRADRVDREWDKGRLKLEKMFICDPPADGSFNPLTDNVDEWCTSSGCPKSTSYGYPDYPTSAGDCYPWASGKETSTDTYPNDNNRLLWTVKPIGESPDLGWHQGNASGSDDADWFIYDDIGRTIRKYGNQYRKPNFGDGIAAPHPVEQIFWSRGGYPTEVVRPSGDNNKAYEHTATKYDMLGRPITVSHILDGVYTPVSGGSGVAWDDESALSYDRFGALSEYKQKFKGMFPDGCSGNWITYGLEREGTPQQAVSLGGRPLTPWQGPRVVRQTLPAGKELGMAYFPNPAESTETSMFAGGGVDDMLTPARLDWALGRTTGLFEGHSTDHYDIPLAKYGYLGMALPMHRYLPGLNLDKWQLLPSKIAPSSDGENHPGFTPQGRHAPDWRHRLRDDMWGRPMDTNPSDIPTQMAFRVEGHENIRWLGNSITSYLDPATSPDFGTSGTSPVADFPVHGHDEYYRHDCSGRTIYWLAGQASKWTTSSAATAWTNGVSSPIGAQSDAAVAPGGISESEFRWPTPDTGCGSSGTGGWLIAPRGEFNVTHPLSPNGASGDTEWARHPIASSSEECSPFGINGRFYQTDRKQADASSTSSVTHWPFFNAYDAAGNLRYDGQHYFAYDGSNRLRDVYLRGWDTSGNPVQGYKLAHYDYNGLGQLVKSRYNTDGDNSLDDEDTEWTPRDPLGRPIGIWRQAPGTTTCAKPYQLFGYLYTGLRGTGFDASGGILDCPAVRWRDADGVASNGLEETLYYLQDLRGDVTGLGESTKFGLLERVRYGPTGRPEVFPAADIDFDGAVTETDDDAFQASLSAFGSVPTVYDPRADLNHDGVIDSTDEEAFLASYDRWFKYSGNWKLSQGDGLTPGNTGADAGLDNRFGWRGYWYDPHLQKYHVRHRVYDPREGRWMQNDPLGFAAGDQDLYRYCNGEYSTGYDPTGLVGEATTQVGDDCGCPDEGEIPQAPGRRGDVFDQLGVGDDRLNENTRAGQRERSEDSSQFGRNVTGVANGLNDSIPAAVSGFVQMFNPVHILEAVQANNRRLNALSEGDPLPMLDHLLAPVDAVTGMIDRWNNASEEERYYMGAYGTGYVATTAAMTYGSGAAAGVGMNALASRRGIGRVYALRGTRSNELWKIGATMRGFDQSGRLIRAAEQIKRLARRGHWEALDYVVLEVLPRGSTRKALLEAEQYHFRLHDLGHLGCPTLPPGNPVRR